MPKGFDVPAGVTLTKGGTVLTEDESASVIYQVGKSPSSAITVTVTSVAKGDIDDFKFFSLDEETKQASPFYVSVTVKNEGPAGLGGAALPIYAHDSSNTIFPPNELVGDFKPCPNAGAAQDVPAGLVGRSVSGLPRAQGQGAAVRRPPDRFRQGRHHLDPVAPCAAALRRCARTSGLGH